MVSLVLFERDLFIINRRYFLLITNRATSKHDLFLFIKRPSLLKIVVSFFKWTPGVTVVVTTEPICLWLSILLSGVPVSPKPCLLFVRSQIACSHESSNLVLTTGCNVSLSCTCCCFCCCAVSKCVSKAIIFAAILPIAENASSNEDFNSRKVFSVMVCMLRFEFQSFSKKSWNELTTYLKPALHVSTSIMYIT